MSVWDEVEHLSGGVLSMHLCNVSLVVIGQPIS
jgi:hypothetical protein